jgi:ankyrin repeat protein
MSAEIFSVSDVVRFLEENEARECELVPARWLGTAMSSFYMPAETCRPALDRKMLLTLECGMVDTRGRMADGRGVLHVLAEFGYSRSVFAMVCAFGAAVDDADADGRTPLMWAASAGRGGSSVRVLLGLGADVRASDRRGRTALHFAAMTGSGAVTELLLAGADAGAEDDRGRSPVYYASRAADAEFVTSLFDGYTPTETSERAS